MLLSPILNKWVECISRDKYKYLLICLFLYQSYFGFFPAQVAIGISHHGCSIFSFVLLYLLGRYYHLYGISLLKKYNTIIYIICTSFIVSVASIALYYGGSTTMVNKVYDSDNPIVILSALSFFYFFEKRNIEYNRIINRLATSSIAVLIIHSNGFVHAYLKQYYNFISNYHFFVYIVYLFLSIGVVYLLCVLLDELRIRSFDKVKKYINL